MRTYLMKINEPSLQKVQVRDNIRKDKRDAPKHGVYQRFDVPIPISSASYYPPSMDSFARENEEFHSFAFETIALVTAIWIEINRDGVNSYGYHIFLRDFMEIPQGCSMAELFEVRDSEPMDALLNVQYYRDEIDMLRDRVRYLERELKSTKEETGDNSYLERMGIV